MQRCICHKKGLMGGTEWCFLINATLNEEAIWLKRSEQRTCQWWSLGKEALSGSSSVWWWAHVWAAEISSGDTFSLARVTTLPNSNKMSRITFGCLISIQHRAVSFPSVLVRSKVRRMPEGVYRVELRPPGKLGMGNEGMSYAAENMSHHRWCWYLQTKYDAATTVQVKDNRRFSVLGESLVSSNISRGYASR